MTETSKAPQNLNDQARERAILREFYKIAEETAIERLGGHTAARVVGPQILRAFIAEEILKVTTSVPNLEAERVGELATALYRQLAFNHPVQA